MNNSYCIKNSKGLLFASAAFSGTKLAFTNYLAMARLFNTCKAFYYDAKTMALAEDDSDDALFGEVWNNVAILAYVPQNSLGFEEPSYGYTYRLPNHPFAEKPYWDNSKKSWIYGVTYERKPVLTGISSGYLFSEVVE
ncbi:MAG: hypothetical protein HRU28_04425 [Rhizobiales bacterium]|nr:hypothetical protein [Hyphomicrobiales bacterium]